MKDFDKLVAVVTGGGNGIGAATADLFRERGAQVAVLDLDVSHAPRGVLALSCDLTDRTAVDAAIATVVRERGGLDILVNNAGIGAVGDVSANDDSEWARVLDVNVTAIARTTRAALPHLRRSTDAAIVNMCSAVAYVGVRQRALYSASKGAVAALTAAMAADHVAEGIRVNAVSPGTADTAWVARLVEASASPSDAAAALRSRQPMGRLVTAQEVAHAVVHLASRAAASTTGTVVHVDGGMTSLRL